MWSSSAALAVTLESRQELERIVRSGKTEQRVALRARIVLGAADGKSNNALARELGTSRPTVLDWRQRFADGGVKALYDDRPRGRSFEPLARAKEAEIIARTQTAPEQASSPASRNSNAPSTTTLNETMLIRSPSSGRNPRMTSSLR